MKPFSPTLMIPGYRIKVLDDPCTVTVEILGTEPIRTLYITHSQGQALSFALQALGGLDTPKDGTYTAWRDLIDRSEDHTQEIVDIHSATGSKAA
jgi:hypothetical protein